MKYPAKPRAASPMIPVSRSAFPAAPVCVVAAVTVLLWVDVWLVVCVTPVTVLALARCVEECVEVWLPFPLERAVSIVSLLVAALVVMAKVVSAVRRVRVGYFILNRGLGEGKRRRGRM